MFCVSVAIACSFSTQFDYCSSDKEPKPPLYFPNHQVGGEKFEDNHRLSVSDSLTASDQYPGDRELTCRFTLDISGIAESRYTFGVIYYPPISDPPQSTIKEADAIPPLDLGKGPCRTFILYVICLYYEFFSPTILLFPYNT